jgi:ABC-type sugar transport system substrate-binding protein
VKERWRSKEEDVRLATGDLRLTTGDLRLRCIDLSSRSFVSRLMSHVSCLTSLVLLLLLLIGCGEDEAKIRVGVCIPEPVSPDLRLISQAIKENAEKHTARIVQEKEGLAGLLDKGIDVLVINYPDPRELEYSVRETHRKSIPVVILDCPPPRNLHVEASIRVNQFEAGKMAADYVAEKLGGKGNVILLEGPRDDETARQITLGMYSVLEQYDSIRIVAAEQHPGWDKRLAAETARSTLKKYADNIQAILAGSSQLAMGAVQAVRERRLADKVITAGIGADLDACRAIIAGTHDAEVDMMPYERGLEALSVAVDVAEGVDFNYDQEMGEHDPKIKVKFGPLRMITRKNVSVMELAWPELVGK